LPFVNLGTDLLVTTVVVGGFHACAIIYPGRLKCWGDNESGQLGLGRYVGYDANGNFIYPMYFSYPAHDDYVYSYAYQNRNQVVIYQSVSLHLAAR
jgi:hypothetical protein